jgi:hypothetical protein
MSKIFDITIDGVNFGSDNNGFLNLNSIATEFGLPQVSQWRNKEKRALVADAKLQGLSYKGCGGAVVNYWAGDEDATIFYAMYISYEFGLKVVQAFNAMRNGRLLEAAKIADSTQVESKAFSAWLEMEDGTIQQALKMLGINRPNFFQALIKKPSQKTSFLDRGILKQRNYGTHGVALRMTSFGKNYILDNRDTINDTIERLYQESKTPVM